MENPKLPNFTDLSLIERLTKADISHLLINLALYLSFVFPLTRKSFSLSANSHWKETPTEIILIIFLLSGFGLLYSISSIHIRYFLISIRIPLESLMNTLSKDMGKKSPSKLYVENTAIISKFDINSYLLTNENKWLEKIYLDRIEMNEKYNLGRENMVVTFVVFSLHVFLKSSFYVSIVNLIPAISTFKIVVFLWLLYSASELFPEDNNYFFLPGNPIRDCKTDDSK